MGYDWLVAGLCFGVGFGAWLLVPFVIGTGHSLEIRMKEFLAGMVCLALSIGALGGMVYMIVSFLSEIMSYGV